MSDHEGKEFQRIAIPVWLYGQIKAVRAELVRQGLDSVPADLVPPEYAGGGDVTLGLVIAMGQQALRRARR